MSTDDLRKACARKVGLRMLLDIGQLRKTIKNGVEMKTWIYCDAAEEFGYDHEAPPPAFQVSDTALLYTPEEAARPKVRIKGKWQPEKQPGVYTSWPECFAQINGFSGGSHKAFDTLELANEAFGSHRDEFRARHPDLFASKDAGPRQPRLPIAGRPLPGSYAVDAACSGAPGPVEYRCVQVTTGHEVFRRGPFENGTNNIGEFLALVHALALFQQRGIAAPIYSDSVTALGWGSLEDLPYQAAPRRCQRAAL